jgi:BirA family biotin operon repressor/biotin-[acetyl-CoA-carboxylase] ligase
MMLPLSLPQIKTALANQGSGPFGVMAHYHARISSTNDAARKLAETGAPEGTVVVADEQTRGRGRLDRRWIAPPNTSLLFSVIFRPLLPPDQAHRLVIACGLALAEACEATANVRVSVKWPNDLQINGRKVAGVLAESAIAGEKLAWGVVGAGLNVLQTFEPDNPLAETATSLRAETGKDYDRAALLAQVLARLNDWYALPNQNVLIAAWRTRCAMLGQSIRIETPNGLLVGLAEDIDEAGALLVRDAESERHRLTVGEATIMMG